jgi:hypothetical protein
MKQHRGISMHAIPVGANIGGAIFTIGIIVAVLIGLPVARWFLLASVVGGGAVFLLLRFSRRSN